jgi:hypothetical protein
MSQHGGSVQALYCLQKAGESMKENIFIYHGIVKFLGIKKVHDCFMNLPESADFDNFSKRLKWFLPEYIAIFCSVKWSKIRQIE